MIRINIDDPQLTYGIPDSGGTETMNYQGQPFTGIVEEYYNDVLVSERQYENSYSSGRTAVYWPNGQLKDESFEKHNRFYGSAKFWDEQGNLVGQTNFDDDGNYIFMKDWDTQGNLTRHWEWTNGVLVKIIG